MKYLIEMNQLESGFEIKYKEGSIIKTSTFTTYEDAMLFINELNLTGI
jgi:pterin-4a-carbinolamine dehydratase